MRNIIRPSPELVALRKKEIAKRYERKASRYFKKKPRTQAALRLADISKVIADRFGPEMKIPESDANLDLVRIVCHHIGHLAHSDQRARDWLNICTPWLPIPERERLLSEIEENPLRWSADLLAWKLKLNDETRTRLGITTIGATDCSKEQRAERRKEKRREYDKLRRPKIPKTEPPWRILGISRRTWYRLGKPRPRT